MDVFIQETTLCEWSVPAACGSVAVASVKIRRVMTGVVKPHSEAKEDTTCDAKIFNSHTHSEAPPLAPLANCGYSMNLKIILDFIQQFKNIHITFASHSYHIHITLISSTVTALNDAEKSNPKT